LSAIVTGETPRKERESILARFKARLIKYIVNVSVLTTGFDAPHVDCIAILRKTESVGLLQQIIGRGLRLDEGKDDCLVLDYTTNLEDHCPDGDLFSPVVKAGPAAGGSGEHEFLCEMCGGKNHFILRGDYVSRGELSVPADENGYLLDGTGARVKTEFGPVPVHFGRRCQRMTKHRGKWDRCEYRWTHKVCPHCDAENDISARYCVECRGEIVDPNTRLVADFRAMKSDPTQRQTDLIVSIEERPGVSKNGNNTMRLDIVTPYRSFSVWLLPESDYYKHQRAWAAYAAVRGEAKTVTYRKDAESGFYQVIGWNRHHDVSPDEREEEFAHAAE
jgi:DNA repair protein RadD